MGWIERAKDRDRWRERVNALMNLLVPENEGNILTTLEPVNLSRRLCSME